MLRFFEWLLAFITNLLNIKQPREAEQEEQQTQQLKLVVKNICKLLPQSTENNKSITFIGRIFEKRVYHWDSDTIGALQEIEQHLNKLSHQNINHYSQMILLNIKSVLVGSAYNRQASLANLNKLTVENLHKLHVNNFQEAKHSAVVSQRAAHGAHPAKTTQTAAEKIDKVIELIANTNMYTGDALSEEIKRKTSTMCQKLFSNLRQEENNDPLFIIKLDSLIEKIENNGYAEVLFKIIKNNKLKSLNLLLKRLLMEDYPYELIAIKERFLNNIANIKLTYGNFIDVNTCRNITTNIQETNDLYILWSKVFLDILHLKNAAFKESVKSKFIKISGNQDQEALDNKNTKQLKKLNKKADKILAYCEIANEYNELDSEFSELRASCNPENVDNIANQMQTLITAEHEKHILMIDNIATKIQAMKDLGVYVDGFIDSLESKKNNSAEVQALDIELGIYLNKFKYICKNMSPGNTWLFDAKFRPSI